MIQYIIELKRMDFEQKSLISSINAFFSSYLGHVLDSSDIDSIPPILETIFANEQDLPFISPLLTRIVFTVEDTYPQFWFEALQKIDNENMLLTFINDKLVISQNSRMKILFCDTFQEFFWIDPSSLITSEDEESLVFDIFSNLDHCVELLNYDCLYIKKVLATAYLKSFIRAFTFNFVKNYEAKMHPQFYDQLNAMLGEVFFK